MRSANRGQRTRRNSIAINVEGGHDSKETLGAKDELNGTGEGAYRDL